MRVLLSFVVLTVACRRAPSPDEVRAGGQPKPPGAPTLAPGPVGVQETHARPSVVATGCDPEVEVPGRTGRSATPHRDVLGHEPAPELVRIGWPSADPSTSASFVWGTDGDTLATVLEIGVGADDLQRVHGASYRFGSTDGNAGPDRIHEVKLCAGLTPGTRYRYRVGGDGAWSDFATFTTAPAPGTTSSFRVAMAGDSRGGVEVWGRVMELIDAEDPDFILFSGDFVTDGSDASSWNDLFAAAGDVLSRRVLVPAHGNHESLAVDYFAQFSLPGNEQWFTHVYGDLQIVVLNDTVVSDHDLEVSQVRFLDEAFGRSLSPWRMVMHHRSAWSSSEVHGSAEDVREAWVPSFERHQVDLVLAGHNHVYERTVAISRGAEVPPGRGPTYVTSGGAGASLYEGFDDEWFSEVREATRHYVIVDFGPDELHAVVRDLSGNTIDRFTLPR